jgi:hypothetical protein
LSFFPLGPSVYTLTGILLEALDRQYCWGCDTPGTHSELPSTELMLLDTLASSLSESKISSDISLGLSNLGLLLGPLITLPLTPTVQCLLRRITSSLCNTVDVNPAWSQRNETVSRAQNGAVQSKRMADKSLFIAVCQHIYH